MKETFIVLLEVDVFTDARRVCESIENSTFKLDNVNSWNIAKKIKYEMGIVEDHNGVEVWALTDFMDRVNDEEFNPDTYFMSYVHGVYDDGETMSDTDD